MFFRPPYPGPPPYDPSGYSKNPAQSIPGPLPDNSNTAWWTGDTMPLSWTNGTGVESGVWWTATWKSPLFDFRPEFKGSAGMPSGGVPIWKGGYQAGTRLWVQVGGLNIVSATSSATYGLRVQAQEFGHLFDPRKVSSLSPLVDVTKVFVHGGESDSAILEFFPPGDGYPLKLWRVELTFEKIVDTTPGAFHVTGSVY